MTPSKNFYRLFWPGVVLTACLISIWSLPFRYDSGNSGRYLLVVAKRMDPSLFPGDIAVNALARFDSLFYRMLPAVFHGPDRFESDLFLAFLGMKIALMLSLFWLIRTLTREPLAAVLFLAWCSQLTGAVLGGVQLFSNLITHNDIALVLGILAITCALRRWYGGFWLLICLSLFVHSLVTIHLLAAVLPVLLLSERHERTKLLLGAGGFLVCFLAYLQWMTPPRMSAQEAAIFLAAKGQMQHISPLAQGVASYITFALLLALAALAQRRFLSSQPAAKLVLQFALCGTAIALLLGFAAAFGRILSIVQAQPMRIFFWVTLFLEIIVAWAAAVALFEKRPVAWVLLGVILFRMTDSLWADGLSLLAITGMAYDFLVEDTAKSAQLARWSKWVLWAFASMVLGFALSGHKGPLQSIRDPWLIVLGVCLLTCSCGCVAAFDQPKTIWLLTTVCLCAAAVGAQHGWARVREKELRSNRASWLAVCDWCEKNSNKADLFLTPPTGDNFRIHALRSTIGEEMSSLAWVDPTAYKSNMEFAATIRANFKTGRWDLDGLREAARAHRARFVVVDGAYMPSGVPAFSQGVFSVHRAD